MTAIISHISKGVTKSWLQRPINLQLATRYLPKKKSGFAKASRRDGLETRAACVHSNNSDASVLPAESVNRQPTLTWLTPQNQVDW